MTDEQKLDQLKNQLKQVAEAAASGGVDLELLLRGVAQAQVNIAEQAALLMMQCSLPETPFSWLKRLDLLKHELSKVLNVRAREAQRESQEFSKDLERELASNPGGPAK